MSKLPPTEKKLPPTQFEVDRVTVKKSSARAMALVGEVAAGLGTTDALELAGRFRRCLSFALEYVEAPGNHPKVLVTSRSRALVDARIDLKCVEDAARGVLRVRPSRGGDVLATYAEQARACILKLQELCDAAGDEHLPPKPRSLALPNVDTRERGGRLIATMHALRAFDAENRAARQA